MRARSAKKTAADRERDAFRRAVGDERGWFCEGYGIVSRFLYEHETHPDGAVLSRTLDSCTVRGTELHERKKRSRHGDLLDRANVLLLCGSCHRFTEAETRLATLVGMLVPSWQTVEAIVS